MSYNPHDPVNLTTARKDAAESLGTYKMFLDDLELEDTESSWRMFVCSAINFMAEDKAKEMRVREQMKEFMQHFSKLSAQVVN